MFLAFNSEIGVFACCYAGYFADHPTSHFVVGPGDEKSNMICAWFCEGHPLEDDEQPTHWMPFPDPPEL